MKLLPLQFFKNAYQYTQVYRDNNFAIYEQTDKGIKLGFEVFQIVKNEVRTIFNSVCDAKESIPSTSSWGNGKAFTVNTLQRAHEKIKEMGNMGNVAPISPENYNVA